MENKEIIVLLQQMQVAIKELHDDVRRNGKGIEENRKAIEENRKGIKSLNEKMDMLLAEYGRIKIDVEVLKAKVG